MKKRMIMILAGVLAMVVLFTACNVAPTGGTEPATNDTTATDPTDATDAADKKDQQAQLLRNQVVATAGAYELTNSQLQVFYGLQVLNFVSQYGAYISYSGIDVTKPLDEQIYDQEEGTTWQEYFLDAAISEWVQYCVMSGKAQENNFEMPAQYAKELENLKETVQQSATEGGFQSIDEMLQQDMGVTVEYEDYYNYVTLYYTSNLYVEQLRKNVQVSDDEIEKYFEENKESLEQSSITKDAGNCVDVRHILIMPEGGTLSDDGTTTTYSDAEWEACRVKAQAVYDEWLAGEKTEDSFGLLANDKSQDQNGEVTNGGIYENVTEGRMVEEFEDWCFEDTRQPGDHGLVKTQYGYHVMYFVGSEAIWSRYCRLGIQSLEVEELAEEYLNETEWKVDKDKIALANIKLS